MIVRCLFLVAVFALSACQTDQYVRDNLPAICRGATTTHNAFLALAELGYASERTIRREAIAWNSLVPLCTNPQQATTADVLIAAATAYATIRAAKDAAENPAIISK